MIIRRTLGYAADYADPPVGNIAPVRRVGSGDGVIAVARKEIRSRFDSTAPGGVRRTIASLPAGRAGRPSVALRGLRERGMNAVRH